IQLDNRTEIMFYMLRDKDDKVKSASSGTIVWADQRTRHLLLKDVQIKVLDKWESPKSHGTYPISWQFKIPDLGIDLRITPAFKNQELNTQTTTRITYWEGAVKIIGKMASKKVTGQGYVEMTGYVKGIKR
ncbi:MAG TPA: carotenoid 1,2-hydratase, partial [Spirochaetes bacterium]|nr:carotenoid 1,2-hydratase [Spirochaetota bacterium]